MSRVRSAAASAATDAPTTSTTSADSGPTSPARRARVDAPRAPRTPGHDAGPSPSPTKEIVVLVHGLIGWGEDKLGEFRYWGFSAHPSRADRDRARRAAAVGGPGPGAPAAAAGVASAAAAAAAAHAAAAPGTGAGTDSDSGLDLAEILAAKTGLPVYVASVSPASSNHERACELYAQIRGVRTVYGELRSRETRGASAAAPGSRLDFSVPNAEWPNRSYGWLPRWGLDADGGVIHFVGHSMGGNTVRALERLLRDGYPGEVVADADDGGARLLAVKPAERDARARAIRSVCTVSTPHDGSPIPDVLGDGFIGLITAAIAGLGVFNGHGGIPGLNRVEYSLDLQRIGLNDDGDGIDGALVAVGRFVVDGRVFGYAHLAHHDLNSAFSAAFNRGGPAAYPDTKYLALATARTRPLLAAEIPELGMLLPLHPAAIIAGTRRAIADFALPRERFQNDGLVTLHSGRGPHVGPGGAAYEPRPVADVAGGARAVPPGHWHYVDLPTWDHGQIVGAGVFAPVARAELRRVYEDNVGEFILGARL